MPLLVPSFQAMLMANMASAGMVGPKTPDLCLTIADGALEAIVGKSFTTSDSGLTIGFGSGVAVGLNAISSGAIMGQMIALLAAGGMSGPKMPDLADVIAKSFVQQMKLASLTSTNNPVFLGSGTIIPGSITVLSAELIAKITNKGIANGMGGPMWPIMALAIGTSLATGLATATATLSISGVWAGLPPLPPGGTPGAGTGIGSIS